MTINVLDIKFYSRDLGDEYTIRQYLKLLLETLWDQGEGFSGKRPFGNSGWQCDLELALVVAGVVDGSYTIENQYTAEEYYELDDCDYAQAHRVIADAIQAL